jgi:hypothetical protein
MQDFTKLLGEQTNAFTGWSVRPTAHSSFVTGIELFVDGGAAQI